MEITDILQTKSLIDDIENSIVERTLFRGSYSSNILKDVYIWAVGGAGVALDSATVHLKFNLNGEEITASKEFIKGDKVSKQIADFVKQVISDNLINEMVKVEEFLKTVRKIEEAI